MNFEEFEEKIGVSFKDKDLLKQAFTHRSFLNENKRSGKGHNERLEFLGDAVLELVITDALYKKFPKGNEGEMTAYRASLVNTDSLSYIATSLGMNSYLLLSKGESKDIGRARQYILANTLEALIGSIYLDRGYEVAKVFIEKNIFVHIDKIIKNKLWIDSKSLFQEKAQEFAGSTPTYKTTNEIGPDHDKKFVVIVMVGDEEVATGEGRSKQDAEQDAARKALEKKGWI